jgi:hypothetical protein
MRRKLTALIALTSTACTSWHQQRGPIPSATESAAKSAGGKPIHVVLNTGAVADIYEATVVGDSIVGMSGPTTKTNRQRVALATSDVRSVSAKKFSPVRTVFAVLGITVAVAIIAGAVAAGSSGGSSDPTCASTSA